MSMAEKSKVGCNELKIEWKRLNKCQGAALPPPVFAKQALQTVGVHLRVCECARERSCARARLCVSACVCVRARGDAPRMTPYAPRA
eukprot:3993178-Pleurochrysis_carterae.AAC.1